MNKSVKRLCLILGTLMMLFAGVISANAADRTVNKKLSIKANKWTTLKGTDYSYKESTDVSTYTYSYYKIVIPKDGYITISLKSTDSYNPSAYLFEASQVTKKPEDSYAYLYDDNKKAFTKRLALQKGTYYIRADDYSNLRCKYTFKAVKYQSNYSLSKAVSLKSGKQVEIVQSLKNNYSRWYKIKTTSKRRIAVKLITDWDSSNSDSPYLYDKNGKAIRLNAESDGYSRSERLPAGTYYVRIPRASWLDEYDSIITNASHTSLIWK